MKCPNCQHSILAHDLNGCHREIDPDKWTDCPCTTNMIDVERYFDKEFVRVEELKKQLETCQYRGHTLKENEIPVMICQDCFDELEDYKLEPIVHSHLTDELGKRHPLAFEQVHCQANRAHKCNLLLHADNNECMTTWVEFAGKQVCANIFAQYIHDTTWGVLTTEEFLEYIKGIN